MLASLISFIEIYQVKYLNNVVEQDHRFIKEITRSMMGFKAFHSAQATIDGIETAHMIRKKTAARRQYSGLYAVHGVSRIILSSDKTTTGFYKICDRAENIDAAKWTTASNFMFVLLPDKYMFVTLNQKNQKINIDRVTSE